MRFLARHDTLIAIIGTAVLTVGYYWGIVSPNRLRAQKIENEIAQAHAMIGAIPSILTERTELQQRLDAERERSAIRDIALPAESHVSDVLHQVTSLAIQSGLSINRLEPLPSVDFAVYTSHPFHLSCRGTFADVSRFLKGMEQQKRLVTFGNADFTRGNEGPDAEGARRLIQANLHFNVYSRHAESTKVAENTISPGRESSDN